MSAAIDDGEDFFAQAWFELDRRLKQEKRGRRLRAFVIEAGLGFFWGLGFFTAGAVVLAISGAVLP